MATPQMVAPHAQMDGTQQTSHTHRTTRRGRKIWYRLTVLQEPERARACGSGPKSTTDRRPVDPPPVIELRIFEGETMESGKDITFTYNANFFLFTTLEHARPVANGRVNTPAATTPPVLTGMFVSGMAYLDRPAEAGYFLFPDLSVRHEGRYKLIFNLYEQTKEDKDRGADAAHLPHRMPAPHGMPQPQGDLADLDECFDHRLKVESRPFSVYSAKKFPGLTESTFLSKTISEQGCRVRIRRDVRMRRRENKPSAGTGSDYEAKQKEDYERRQRTQTPEIKPDPFRSRSLSTSSMERGPYPDPYSRRPSVTEYHQQQPPHPPPAYGPAPHTPTSAGGHLYFGQPNNSQYPHPPQQYPPAPQQPQQPQPSPLTPKQHNYPPPPPPPPLPQQQQQQQQQQQRSYPSPSQYAPAAPPSVPPSSSPRPMGHGLERPPSRPHQYSMFPKDSSDNSRQPSASYPPPPVESHSVSGHAAPRAAEGHAAPPSAERHGSPSFAAPTAADSASGSYPNTPTAECHSSSEYISLPGVNCEKSKSMPRGKCDIRLPPIGDFDRPNYVRLPPPSTFSSAGPPPPSVSGTKRGFDQSFNPEGLYQSLCNGARQTDPHLFPPANRMPGYDEPTGPSLQYRRADGNVDAKDPLQNGSHFPATSAPREQFHRAPYNL